MTPGSARSMWARWAAACGFHPPALAFALRTTAAGFAAFLIAYAMGLEHPHWAAMSVWASSQPLREHLLSRGAYRLGGSLAGVAFAVALVLLAQGSLWVLAAGLALWCAGCAWLGNLQRGYRVYGCMLAGYSAAMVVLLQQGPVDKIWPFAADRMLTVVTGVAVALCAAWFFAPRRQSAVLIQQSRAAMTKVLDAAVHRLRHEPPAHGLDNTSLLAGLAEVEELLELYAEGSRDARHTAAAIHHQQHHAMELVYLMAAQTLDAGPVEALPLRDDLAGSLERLVAALQKPAESFAGRPQELEQAVLDGIHACERCVQHRHDAQAAVPPALAALYRFLQAMRQGLRAEQRDMADVSGRPAGQRSRAAIPPALLHRDAVGARQAALRAGLTLLVFGVVWAATGWGLVAFGMLGLSVMLLVFSGFENPQRTMAFVLRGQLIGASLALLCQWLVWPWAQNGWQMVWMTLPFALLAGLFFAHKRTAAGGTDTQMAMFILLAPAFPHAGGMAHNIGMALAIVTGPVMALLVYRWIYPTNGAQRMRSLAAMMLGELPQLAQRMLDAGGAAAVSVSGDWQEQLHHRVLKLVRWGVKTRHPGVQQLPVLWLALRTTQTAMLELQKWREQSIGATPALRRTGRRVELLLRRMAQDGGDAAGKQLAWQALAGQSGLPAVLTRQVAEHHFPAIHAARLALQPRPRARTLAIAAA